MFTVTINFIINGLTKLHQNNVRREQSKWLRLYSQMIITLIVLKKSEKRQILKFETEQEAVECIHSLYLSKFHESYLHPIRKIVHSAKIHYNMHYFYIPPLPKPKQKPSKRKQRQPKTKQAKRRTQPKTPSGVFSNSSINVKHFYQILATLLQQNGTEFIWEFKTINQICAITFKMSTKDVAPIKKSILSHGSIGNVAHGKYIVSSDPWIQFLIHMNVTTAIYQIINNKKQQINKVAVACPSCTFDNTPNALFCDICGTSLTK